MEAGTIGNDKDSDALRQEEARYGFSFLARHNRIGWEFGNGLAFGIKKVLRSEHMVLHG